jgi:hypothetical protein
MNGEAAGVALKFANKKTGASNVPVFLEAEVQHILHPLPNWSASDNDVATSPIPFIEGCPSLLVAAFDFVGNACLSFLCCVGPSCKCMYEESHQIPVQLHVY